MSITRPREFFYEPVSSGGILLKLRFPLKCYMCGAEDHVESRKKLPDQVVKKKAQQMGWVLGRRRDADACPACSGVGVENQLASVFKVKKNGLDVVSAERISQEASEKKKKTAEEILSRLRGEEKKVESAEASRQSPDVSRIIEVLEIVREEMAEIRAAVELLLEQGARHSEEMSRIVELPRRDERPTYPLETVGRFIHYPEYGMFYVRIQREFFLQHVGDVSSVGMSAAPDGRRLMIRRGEGTMKRVKATPKNVAITTGLPKFRPGRFTMIEVADGGIDLVA